MFEKSIIVISLLAFCFVSCTENKTPVLVSDLHPSLHQLIPIQTQKNAISFNFTIEKSKQDTNEFTVNAVLKNSGVSPVFFLTESCGGPKLNIQFSDEYFEDQRNFQCNASWPLKEKIDAGQTYEVELILKKIKPANFINLTFNFCEVSQNFDLENDFSLFDYYRLRNKNTQLLLANPVEFY